MLQQNPDPIHWGFPLRLGAHYKDGFLANICQHTSYCAIAGYMIVAGHGDAKGMESIHNSNSVNFCWRRNLKWMGTSKPLVEIFDNLEDKHILHVNRLLAT